MGCSTLYHLAKFGVSDAVLLERNRLTSGTPWHSAAQVRALRSSRNLTELIRYSISLYGDLEKETGQSTGWICKGSLSVAASEDRLTHVRRQMSLARAFSVRAEAITPQQAQEMWPLMNTKDILGAVFSPDDGRVSPSDLCAALVKGARTRGARVFEKAGITGIMTQGGRVVGIETPQGQIRCDAVVLCTGLWSRENAAMAGIDLPVWPCEHFYLLTEGISGVDGNLPTLSDHDSHLYIRDDSGGLLVGCFEPMGKAIAPGAVGHDFEFQLLDEDWDHFEPMMRNAMHRLPILKEAGVRMLLNGPESFTPDGAFILGESAETRGLHIGCGMNSVGVATGGGAGMALARSILDGKMPMALNEVDPARFPSCFTSIGALCERVPEVLGKHYEIGYPGSQMKTARQLRKPPLFSKWRQEGAHFGQVYGWERPLYFNREAEPVLSFGRPDWFEQVGREVEAAHHKSAIFDQSTFGKIRIAGTDAEAVLNRICSSNMARSPGAVIYTAMLNHEGGFESDLTALRLSEEEYLLYVGTASIRKDLTWLRRHISDSDRVTVEDVTEEWVVLGLMGPRSLETAAACGLSGLEGLAYFRHMRTELDGMEIIAARISYVGESGWELTCRPRDAVPVYRKLRDNGAVPAGAYAQTSMRIEKRFLSYGHDLDQDINPFQCGLGFLIGWDVDFIGRPALEALRERVPERALVTILLHDPEAWALGNEPVWCDGRIVGLTTSAAYGYRMGRNLALGYIDTGIAECLDGAVVQVEIAGEMRDGTVSLKPVFDPDGVRMRQHQR